MKLPGWWGFALVIVVFLAVLIVGSAVAFHEP